MNAGSKPIQFAKEGTDWKITAPLAARADFSAVDGMVGRVESAQMKSIVTDQATPADLKKFGLEKPEVTVTINQGSARAVLAIGGPSGDDVYARDMSKPIVVTVDKSLADGSEEDRRRLPAKGRLRVPRLQCHARRVHARSPDRGIRAGQGPG